MNGCANMSGFGQPTRFFQTNVFNGYVLRMSCGQVEYVDVTVYSTVRLHAHHLD